MFRVTVWNDEQTRNNPVFSFNTESQSKVTNTIKWFESYHGTPDGYHMVIKDEHFNELYEA